MTPPVVLATELPQAGGGLATAAAIGVAAADRPDRAACGIVLVDIGAEPRRPTLLASAHARRLEDRLASAGLSAAARGRLTWVALAGDDWLERLGDIFEAADDAGAVVVHLGPRELRETLACDRVPASAAVVRADIPRQRALAALAVAELRRRRLPVRIMVRSPGRVGARRAIAGIDPGGDLQRAAERAAGRLLANARARRRHDRPPAIISASLIR
jgi:hypothetical protein